MKLKRRIASLLAFVMAFSSIAAFSVSADTINPTFVPIMPFNVTVNSTIAQLREAAVELRDDVAALTATGGLFATEPVAGRSVAALAENAGAAASVWTNALAAAAGDTGLTATITSIQALMTFAEVTTATTVNVANAVRADIIAARALIDTLPNTTSFATALTDINAVTGSAAMLTWIGAEPFGAATPDIDAADADLVALRASLAATGDLYEAHDELGTAVAGHVNTNPAAQILVRAATVPGLMFSAAVPATGDLTVAHQIEARTEITAFVTAMDALIVQLDTAANVVPATPAHPYADEIIAAVSAIIPSPWADITTTEVATAINALPNVSGVTAGMITVNVPTPGVEGSVVVAIPGYLAITVAIPALPAAQGNLAAGARIPFNNQMFPNGFGAINLNVPGRLHLVDRYAAGTAIDGAHVARTPEIIHGSDVTNFSVTMEGWGDNPWNVIRPDATGTPAANAAWSPARLGTDVRGSVTSPGSLPATRPVGVENAFWVIGGANIIGWSGFTDNTTLAGGAAARDEFAFWMTISGQTIEIQRHNTNDIDANSVLRVPLIASGTNAQLRSNPTVTQTRGAAETLVNFAGATGQAALVAPANVVTGEREVTVTAITVRVPHGAATSGNQFALRLPTNFQFVSVGSVTANGTAWPNAVIETRVFETTEADNNLVVPGVIRNGQMAQSVALVTVGPLTGSAISGPHLDIVLNNVRIQSVALPGQAPITGQVNVDLLQGAGLAGITPNRAPAGAFAGGLGVSTMHVATFNERGLAFNTVTGGAGNVPTIVAGFLPAEGGQAGASHATAHERGTGRNQTTGAAAWGNVASVVISENVPDSWLRHGITFTLVDGEGNVHPSAAIRSVQLVSGFVTGSGTANATTHPNAVNANFINRTHQTGAGAPVNPHQVNNVADGFIEATGVRGNASVTFTADGRGVHVLGLTGNEPNNRLQLTAHFAITADVNFDGDVYIAATSQLHGTNVHASMEVDPVRVAEVRRGVTVDSETTVVPVGVQQVAVAEVLLNETLPGDFRIGQNAISLSIGEFGLAHMAGAIGRPVFVPITAGNAANHIEIGGAANEASRVGANLTPFHGAGGTLNINITRTTQGAEASYIRLSGLSVIVDRTVPYGTYELNVRGASVLNNEGYVAPQAGSNVVPLNWNTGVTPNRPTWSNEANYSRFAHGPLVFVNFIDTSLDAVVGGPGAGGNIAFAVPTIVIPHVPGTTFTVDGEEMTLSAASLNFPTAQTINLVSVPANTLFVPVLDIIEAMGGSVQFTEGNMWEGRPHVVSAFLGATRVDFTIGATTFHVNGVEFPMNNAAGQPVAAFIGDGTGNMEAGRTYLPIRFIVQGFGIELQDNVNGTVVIN
ncbi:MAG: copper amine oxidase N-terminal domain-containing protein [Defluviitaleaceae bacterium]|nr:copper amine oxidase N-terminal domain-containing protein [Defluviitaleaceae bacterium]